MAWSGQGQPDGRRSSPRLSGNSGPTWRIGPGEAARITIKVTTGCNLRREQVTSSPGMAVTATVDRCRIRSWLAKAGAEPGPGKCGCGAGVSGTQRDRSRYAENSEDHTSPFSSMRP